LLETDDHIDILDKRHNALESPWLVMKCNDGVSEYGLKLMAV